MKWIISHYIKPIKITRCQNVFEVIKQWIGTVNNTISWVKAIRLSNSGKICHNSRCQCFVLHTLSDSIEPRANGFLVDCTNSSNIHIVWWWSSSCSQKCLVCNFAFFVEKSNKTFAINSLKVTFNLGNTILSISACSINRELNEFNYDFVTRVETLTAERAAKIRALFIFKIYNNKTNLFRLYLR
jgi:hypothetical protein